MTDDGRILLMKLLNCCKGCEDIAKAFQIGMIFGFSEKNDEIDKMIDKVKTITPQETGHWIKYSIPRCGEQHYKCTSCGYYINFGQWGEFYTKEFKYCPNCGVRMVEPQEREGEE